jgi:FAD/FMN-containing dehydrogenase
VATRFQYQLHPISTVLGGMLILPATADIVERSMRIAEQAPDALTIIGNLMKLPPMPFVDPAFHGQVGWAIQLVWAGDLDEGAAWIDRLRALATPIADLVGPMPYPGIYAFNEEAEPAAPGVTRSTFLRTIDAPMLERLIALAGESTAPVAIVQLRVLGGAMARVPVDATAFAHRAEPYLVGVFAMFPDVAERDHHLAWASAAMETMAPAASSVYVNFLEAEGNARIRQAYPDGAFERLAEIKRRYDPDNVFRSNQNITSAA